MPAATLPNAVSAASGEPDAQPATIVPRPPADRGAASSSQVSRSRTGSSRGLMLGLGVTAAVAAVAWLISAVDFTPAPTQSTEPTKSLAPTPVEPPKSLQAVPAAPSSSVAAPASAPAQSPSAVPPPASTTTTVAGAPRRRRFPNPHLNRRQRCGRSRCLAIKGVQIGPITVTEQEFLRSKECQS